MSVYEPPEPLEMLSEAEEVMLSAFSERMVDIISAAFAIPNGILESHPETSGRSVYREIRKAYIESKNGQ